MHDPFVQMPPLTGRRLNLAQWALVVLLATAVVLATVRMLRPQMDERLYAKYRALPQAQFLTTEDQPLSPACKAFNLKQYSKALPLFAEDTAAAFAHEKRFFAALCALELNQIRAAEAQLAPLVQTENPWQQEAIWYKALAHLRGHNRAACVALLQQLKGKGGRHEQEGRLAALLERL